AGLCEAEGIEAGPGVLPLVVRAGGGSFRDALSVLDQLLAGGQTIEYEGALALLGYTSVALLDDVVAAVSAGDGASAFRVIDQVVSTGHEPRRFVEDLLERLRDLIVLAAAGDAAGAAMRELPAYQFERMETQARNLGPAELSRAADLVNDALREMAGATSPRLQLELLIARLLLPAADDGDLGVAARLDRLERGAGAGGVAPAAAPAPAARPAVPVAAPPAPAAAPPAPPADLEDGERHRPPVAPEPEPEPDDVVAPTAAARPTAPVSEAPAGPAEPAHVEPDPAPVTEPAAPEPVAAPTGGVAQVETELLRRRWDEVLAEIATLRRATWALVSQNAQVGELTGSTLSLVFSSAGLATAFRNGSHSEVVQRALHETLGVDVRVEGTLAGAEGATSAPATGAVPVASRAASPVEEPAPPAEPVAAPSTRPVPRVGSPNIASPGGSAGSTASPAASAPSPGGPPSGTTYPTDTVPPWDVPGGTPPSAPSPGEPPVPESDEDAYARARSEIDASDPTIDESRTMGVPLIAEMLGGTIIEEQTDQP
ncbi:MAG: DNA polymerase III subunit gamma and tau, partial [Actinomycetales bacterium]|nr:DNA polymerase III subunit gamma and tau [Actinomycetales bacterium]